MKDKKIFIVLAIITGLIYIVSLLSYIMAKQLVDLIFSAISGILTIANLYTIYKINKDDDNYKICYKKNISKDDSRFNRYVKNDIKLAKILYKNLNKKHK